MELEEIYKRLFGVRHYRVEECPDWMYELAMRVDEIIEEIKITNNHYGGVSIIHLRPDNNGRHNNVLLVAL